MNHSWSRLQGAGCTGQQMLILESRKSRLLASTALDQDCGHQQAERDSLLVYKGSAGKLFDPSERSRICSRVLQHPPAFSQGCCG